MQRGFHYGKEFTSNDKNKIIEFILKGIWGQISVCNKIKKKKSLQICRLRLVSIMKMHILLWDGSKKFMLYLR